MIAKIVTGASFGGCAAYAYGKDQAEVIAHDGIIPDDPKIATKCFEIQSQLNPRVSKPVGHIAISFKPEDRLRLTNEFMVQLVQEYMDKMGIYDTQYVVVRHHNTPNPHCHLIFNRVDRMGNRISDKNEKIRSMNICKEIKRRYGLTFGQNKSLTNKAKLRPDEKLRYRLAEEIKLTLGASRNWQDFSNKLTSYGIRADVRFRSGTTIPQGICFTKYAATFKGSSLDRTLSFSQIDKALSGGINVEWCSQEEHKSMRESESKDQNIKTSKHQNISLMANLSGIASDLIVGMLDSGVGGRSEEQDMRPRKKKGMRM